MITYLTTFALFIAITPPSNENRLRDAEAIAPNKNLKKPGFSPVKKPGFLLKFRDRASFD
jgi:hypothetical protein